MPTGPLTPDFDESEKAPLVVPIWDVYQLGCCSFSPIPGTRLLRVVVPFPLRFESDPDRGAVLRGLWGDSPVYGPCDVVATAARREGGFRFADAADHAGAKAEGLT